MTDPTVANAFLKGLQVYRPDCLSSTITPNFYPTGVLQVYFIIFLGMSQKYYILTINTFDFFFYAGEQFFFTPVDLE